MVALLALGAGAADPTRFASPPRPPRFVLPADSILFADDFSAGLSKWRPDRDSVWSVWHGMLRADLPDQRQLRSVIYAGSPEWRNYAVDLDVCMMRGVDKGVVVRVQGDSGVGVDLRGGSYQDLLVYVREWPAGRSPALNANGTWNHLKVEVNGTRLRVWVNGDLTLDRSETRLAQGRIALPAYTGGLGQCTVYYDNVVVTAR
jgi:pectate lyase